MYLHQVPWHPTKAQALAAKGENPENGWKLYDARILGRRLYLTFEEAELDLSNYFSQSEPSDALR